MDFFSAWPLEKSFRVVSAAVICFGSALTSLWFKFVKILTLHGICGNPDVTGQERHGQRSLRSASGYNLSC